ncbi:MFS transporter [Nakamurella sp.]|uniref:MFS transporter n=1 Tax=Nakamurella sp. TaxID=1869182 RepID=UPI003782DAFD
MTGPAGVPPRGDQVSATRVAGTGAYRRLLVATGAANLADGLQVVAVPWLASVLTRDPVQIALVTAATRIPWLLFSLPVGAITDRFDRRRLIAWADTARTGLLLAFALLLALTGPDGTGNPARAGLLLAGLYVLALLVGLAEVISDNSSQTLIPSIVPRERLETANGRLWAVETVANQFVGPPVAGLLLAAGMALPFFVSAGSFALAAAIVFTIAGHFRAPEGEGPRAGLRREIGEGFRWLWRHRLLRSLAISLGVLNACSALATAVLVLFGQEVAGLDAAAFGLLMTGSAIGAVIGSFVAPWLTRRIRSGTALAVSVVVMAVAEAASGLMSAFWPLWSATLVAGVFIVVWNVITVSLRQSLIPDRLLGRVNSVYRFFGWGTIAIGTLLGGLLVAALEPTVGREWALRLPFLVSGVIQVVLLAWAWPRIGNAPIDRARAAAA